MMHNRFINSTLSELKETNQSPIYGYQHLPLLTLEESIKKLDPLVGILDTDVSTAKKECDQSSPLLTKDESAAIYLYSMSKSLCPRLNEALRAENRSNLKPWFFYLKLLITALEKLPSITKTIWRGIPVDARSVLYEDDIQIWWSVNSCSMDSSIVRRFLDEKGTLFIIKAINGKDISMFSAFPVENEIVLMPGTRLRVISSSFNYDDRLFIILLEETDPQNESQSKPRYLSELMKLKYQQHSRIELIMNPSKSFPIQQSYINLAIVETKDQKEKEKKLLNTKHSNDEIIGTFEEIYGTKTPVEIKDIFKTCKDQTKRLLVFGRAGIGKTTFCQYVAHQWGIGAIWQQYQLVVFIRLRNLTEWRYPPLASGARYSLVDIVKTEYFHHDLTDKYETLLKEELNNSQILWLLDGYDEIFQNIPLHLKYLLEQLLKTPHHILTSRPYLNTLPYDVQMEITGFTDDNITKYVQRFFDRTEGEMHNAPIQTENLLNFLRCNVRIWGIAHIPVTLELICSLWCDTDWSETTTLTITAVYDKMIEWICRRHLEKQNISSNQMTKEDVYQHLYKELTFLECLAFNAMERKSIIISPTLLKIALKESECSLQHQSHLLNIGVLKSLDYKPIGTRLEADKNHYFVHLSFQEYFAARYLVNALSGPCVQKKKATDFFKTHKYNQRYEFIFSFVSGLLNDYSNIQCRDPFWTTLLEEPLDLIGIRHAQVIICCLEDADCDASILRYRESIDLIIKWINYFVCTMYATPRHPILKSLQKSPSLMNRPEIVDAFIKLYTEGNANIRSNVSWFISGLPIIYSYEGLIQLHITGFLEATGFLRYSALQDLSIMGVKAATNEVIHRLTSLLDDPDNEVRNSAYYTLGRICDKATANEVIHRLIRLLHVTNNEARQSACLALEAMGDKAATNEVIYELTSLLDGIDDKVKNRACYALGAMGDKAVTNEVIRRLVSLLGDTDNEVREGARYVLGKMCDNASTNEVIHILISLLDDIDKVVRKHACYTLGAMRGKAATNEVIHRLTSLLDDPDNKVRESACYTFGAMGGNAATSEVIHKLTSLLDDPDNEVRNSACYAHDAMGGKAATSEVIHKLTSLLDDPDNEVRGSAYCALGEMGDKAATNEALRRLTSLLDNIDNAVRQHACHVLGEMGDNAATSEVIHKLTSLLDNTSNEVKESACYVLRKIGEKAATDGVINRLVSLLDNPDNKVRERACDALGSMREKVATNEVIHRLVSLLDDTDNEVRESAYFALEVMGDRAATNEIISKIFVIYDSIENGAWNIQRILRKIFSSLSCMRSLKCDVVWSVSKYVEKRDVTLDSDNVAKTLAEAYLITRIPHWLPVIKKMFFMKGFALTVGKDTITVYNNEVPVPLPLPNEELGQTLRNYFINWPDELLQSYDRIVN